jgi:hypothetical protein
MAIAHLTAVIQPIFLEASILRSNAHFVCCQYITLYFTPPGNRMTDESGMTYMIVVWSIISAFAWKAEENQEKFQLEWPLSFILLN